MKINYYKVSIRKKKNPSGKRQKVHILKDIIVLLEKKMKQPILKNASESTESREVSQGQHQYEMLQLYSV